MKIQEVIERIEKYHPPVDESHTCDVVKVGDTGAECTGIAVTTFASVEVIRKAIAANCNLIVVHEPLFYTHEDKTDWLTENSVFQEKKRLLDENHVTVYRDHDRIHGGPRREREHMDMIFYGIMKTLGWEDYNIGFDLKPQVYKFSPRKAISVADELIEKLDLNGVRMVGDPETMVETVFLCEHVTGAHFGPHDKDSELISEVEAKGYDLMVPFEIIDWTLTEYVRDAAALGRPKVIVEAGHFNVEEAGMKYMAQWLPSLLDASIPVTYIQSGDFFTYRRNSLKSRKMP